MAVSMNSGFMRSDYMISDAVLPLRMEELDLEQLDREAKFSDILGEIGEAPAASPEKVALTDEQSAAITKIEDDGAAELPVLSKAELKALAKAAAEGKIKLDEIPEEYVTDVLLMVIAMLMLGIPEDEIPDTESASKEAAEPVQMDISTAEAFLSKVQENTNITELLQIVSETAGVEIPEDMKLVLGRQVETIALAQEISSDKTAVPMVADVAADTSEVSQAQTVSDAQRPEHDATTEASLQERSEAANTVQGKLTEEFEQLRKIISEYHVRKTETEQPSRQGYTAQTMGADNTAKNRVVSKSDELEMLKGTARSIEAELNIAVEARSENGMQAGADQGSESQQLPMEQMPQQFVSDTPVVFTRSDGSEVEVRPSEIIRQITATIVQQSATAEGDTEYSITLTPEDLGSITVKLTKTVDGMMTVSITADNARTQRLIEQSGAAIQENLRNNGIELENWQTVNQSEQQARAQDYSGSSRNPYYTGDSDSDDEEDADGESFAELITAM